MSAAVLPAGADLRRAALAAAAALALAAGAAAVVAAAFAAGVRDALGFGFAGLPRTLDEAADIFVHNVRLMASIGAASALVQSGRLAAPGGALGPAARALRGGCDVLLAAAVAANAILVGAAVGAYGERMVVALLPFGPLELAAYAVALALYLRARTELLEPRAAAVLASWAVSLLALAALVEALLHL